MNEKKIAAALNTLSLGIAELAEAIQQPGPSAASPSAGSPPVAAPAGSPVPADTFSDGTPIEEPFMEELPVDPIPAVLAATGGTEVTWQPPTTLAPASDGSLLSCPKHHELYMDKGKGKFCPKRSDDPDWSNPKGYCTINPGNVAKYLHEKAAAA